MVDWIYCNSAVQIKISHKSGVVRSMLASGSIPLLTGAEGLRSSQCHCFLNIAFSHSQLKTEADIEKSEEYYLHAVQAAKDTRNIQYII